MILSHTNKRRYWTIAAFFGTLFFAFYIVPSDEAYEGEFVALTFTAVSCLFFVYAATLGAETVSATVTSLIYKKGWWVRTIPWNDIQSIELHYNPHAFSHYVVVRYVVSEGDEAVGTVPSSSLAVYQPPQYTIKIRTVDDAKTLRNKIYALQARYAN